MSKFKIHVKKIIETFHVTSIEVEAKDWEDALSIANKMAPNINAAWREKEDLYNEEYVFNQIKD